MDTKRDLTKELLAGCFHELMLTVPFDKITIKMITDRVGLIRPTFYKHFQDKYEVLEYIFRKNVADNVDLMLNQHMELDAINMLCRCLDNDRVFYRRAFRMEDGPNSFETVLYHYIYRTFLDLAERFRLKADSRCSFLTREIIAEYYTNGLVHTLKSWITGTIDGTPEDFAASFNYLISHSVLDLIEGM